MPQLAKVGGRDGAAESPRPDALGGPDEHLQGPGRGDSDGGAYSQLSFFLSEAEQIRIIDEAENVKTSSAFFLLPRPTSTMCCGWAATRIARVSALSRLLRSRSPPPRSQTPCKTLYHGGNGIGSITAWYAEDGIHLSHGKTARYDKSAQVISWESAAERIGQLLQDGQFATNVELAEAAGYERSLLAEKFWNLYHDFSEEAREPGICPSFPTIRARFPGGICMAHRTAEKPGVSPDPCGRICCLLDGLPAGSGFAALPLPNPKEIWGNLKDLSLPRTTFYLSVDGSTFGQAVYHRGRDRRRHDQRQRI